MLNIGRQPLGLHKWFQLPNGSESCEIYAYADVLFTCSLCNVYVLLTSEKSTRKQHVNNAQTTCSLRVVNM